jgi:hypothetical protein
MNKNMGRMTKRNRAKYRRRARAEALRRRQRLDGDRAA